MVEFTNNLPTPGPENVWGAELNAAINERVDYLNTEVEAIKTSLGTNTNLFRGAWQAPANYLLWSTTFTTAQEVDIFEFYKTGTVNDTETSDPRTTTSSTSGAAVGISSVSAMRFGGIIPGNAGDSVVGVRLNTSEVPSLLGRYISRVEYVTNPQHSAPSSNRATESRINGIFDSNVRIDSTATTWVPKTVNINLINPNIELQYRSNTSGSSSVIIYLSEYKVYGTANNADLYQLHHVVSHNSKFWKSLYNNNSDEPSEASSMWAEIPDFPEP